MGHLRRSDRFLQVCVLRHTKKRAKMNKWNMLGVQGTLQE